MSGSFHDSLGRPHLPAVAIGMTEALVGAVKVEAVGQLGDDFEPGHVHFQLVVLAGQVKFGHLYGHGVFGNGGGSGRRQVFGSAAKGGLPHGSRSPLVVRAVAHTAGRDFSSGRGR